MSNQQPVSAKRSLYTVTLFVATVATMLAVAGCSVMTNTVNALDTSVVPVLDMKGRVIGTQPRVKAMQPATAVTSTGTTTSTTASTTATASSANTSQHQLEVNGERYTDIEYLESVDFNPEGKQKFYTYTDTVTGQRQVVEYTAGVNVAAMSPAKGQSVQAPVVFSSNYDVLDGDAVSKLVGLSCLTSSEKKSAKLVDIDRVNIWPQISRKQLPIRPILAVHKLANKPNLKVYSYASSKQKPNYYWPLVVFMDVNGCTISATSQYYIGNVPESGFRHKGIYGLLAMPANTHYVVMMPIAQLAQRPELTLAKTGALELVWLN